MGSLRILMLGYTESHNDIVTIYLCLNHMRGTNDNLGLFIFYLGIGAVTTYFKVSSNPKK